MGFDPGVLVTGAGGQVGRALQNEWRGPTYLEHAELDVTDAGSVRSAIRVARVVIHLAAFTNVDGCEEQPEIAHQVNAEGTRLISEAARSSGARVIFISTDYVFDGRSGDEYAEDDACSPLNVYGRSKLEAERHVQRNADNLTIRTSWVFGDGKNFIKSILRAAENGIPLRVVCDQRGRPTYARDLAAGIRTAAERNVSGIVHVCGDGDPCTWAELARVSLEARGSSARVEPVTSQEYETQATKTVAARPANSVLSLNRARALGFPLRPWRRSVEDYVRELP
jgi:dTDP-4-dehydrorhamnose reductase